MKSLSKGNNHMSQDNEMKSKIEHLEFVLSIREQQREQLINAMREIGVAVDTMFRDDEISIETVVRQVKRLRNDFDDIVKQQQNKS